MIHAFVTKKRERKDRIRIFSCPLHLLTDYITEEEAYAVVRIEMSGFRIRAFFFFFYCAVKELRFLEESIIGHFLSPKID